MKSLIFLIFIPIFYFTNTQDIDENTKELNAHIELLPLMQKDNCQQKYYSISLHDTIQLKSAWFNPKKNYNFTLNDDEFEIFKNEFNFSINKDKGIDINCVDINGDWYKIKNKKGTTYWTSTINYFHFCQGKSRDNINLRYKK